MLAKISAVRCSYFWIAGKTLVIIISSISSCFDVFIQVGKFDIENGSLYGIQPAVAPNHLMVIPFVLPMICDHPELCSEIIIIGTHSTTVTIATQVFTWEK